MKSRREQLLGYLLGALDDAEARQVEAELDKSPALRVEMARFQELLSRLGMDEQPEEFEPPLGLARRTCDFVSAHGDEAAVAEAPLASPIRLSPTALGQGESSRSYTFTDMLVACSVLLTFGALLFPSINSMRLQAQRATCQYRLVQTGAALWDYALTQPRHHYPFIPERGNFAVAGNVPLTLVSSGQELERLNLLCPSDNRSCQMATQPMPTCDEVRCASGPELRNCQQRMGGTFAFNMGYTQNGRLVPAVLLSREDFALVADSLGDATQPPHDGLGLNVLFEDGHVRFLPLARKPKLADDPYHNRWGYIGAGLDFNDAALGASDAHPLPYDEEPSVNP